MSFLDNIDFSQKQQDIEMNDFLVLKNIDELKTLIYEEKFYSEALKDKFKDLNSRFYEPLRIAITGGFSSGKSTFLNAILSQDLLPSGANPVTSKVNYIKYGRETRLEVTYKDGREQFFDVNSISLFTDQRNKTNVDDIAFLTLYSPLKILEDITFIDTPGLGSNSSMDTQTTEDILEKSDGIIWITPIDNAAKESETKILEKYIKNYSSKALCIVNQKDKIDDEDELEEVIEYVEGEWDRYFSKIEAISAKQALDAKGNSKQILIDKKIDNYTIELNLKLKALIENNELDLNSEILKQSKQVLNDIELISNKNIEKNESLLKESNINSVLYFIENEIKPLSKPSKEFAITQEIKTIVKSVISENQIFIDIFTDLIDTIYNYDQISSKRFDEYKKEYIEKANKLLTNDIEQIIHQSHYQIMQGWTTCENYKAVEETIEGFFVDDTVVDYQPYQSAYIDYKKIDDTKIQILVDNYFENLEIIDENIREEFGNIYLILEKSIDDWEQRSIDKLNSYNKLYSQQVFLSFKDKYITPKFEIILNNFENDIMNSISSISIHIKHLKIALGWTYDNALYSTIGNIDSDINLLEFSWEKLDEEIVLPTSDSILERLEENFNKKQLLGFLSNEDGFFNDTINIINKAHSEVAFEEIEKYKQNQQEFIDSKEKLQLFMDSLSIKEDKDVE